MDRLIIESIEGRIMLGITMFVAVMILIGWVAINEPARMAEFVEQHEGRSIERGAELFMANCSSCHGNNGLGIAGRAPGLNNPHMFGYSYLASVNNEIASLQRELLDINGVEGLSGTAIAVPDQIGTQELLENRRQELLNEIAMVSDEEARDLIVELQNAEATLSDDTERVAERIAAIEAGDPLAEDTNPTLTSTELDVRLEALRDNIPTRIETIDTRLNGDGTEENPGLLAEREARLEELNSAIISGYLPRLEQARALAEENDFPLYLTNYIDTDTSRLSQIEFGGALDGYLTTTLIHGRPGSGDVWNGNVMVAWSQRAGGPLRDDQIDDIVAYIVNWDKGDGWTIDDFNAVNQYALLHTAFTGESGSDVETVGTNVEDILASLPEGDPERGGLLYEGQDVLEIGVPAGCSGCHAGGVVGPATEGTWTRVQNQRLTDPALEGYTAEQYLVEAIVQPNAYLVPGYSSGVMNANYGEQLTAQDLADIIAYIETQNQ